jgi:hypothetical protein
MENQISDDSLPEHMDDIVWAFTELMLAEGMRMYEWMRQQAERKRTVA